MNFTTKHESYVNTPPNPSLFWERHDFHIKQETIMSTETGTAVSKQKLIDLKARLLALKEHL